MRTHYRTPCLLAIASTVLFGCQVSHHAPPVPAAQGLAAAPTPTTQAEFRLYSARLPPKLDPAKLDQIKDGMTLGEIADVLGPGWNFNGIIRWFFTDGRQLWVWPHHYTEAEVITRTKRPGANHGMWIMQGRALPATRPTTSQATTTARQAQ